MKHSFKHFLFIFFGSAMALIPTFTWAFPAEGDFVQYMAPYKNSPVIMEKRVVAHDNEHNSFTVSTITTYKERVIQDQLVELPESFLYNPIKIQHVLNTCASREGALGLMLIQGKEMQVCEFYNEDSQLTDILGPVPFGQIRFQVYLEEEDFLDFNLTKYEMGLSSIKK